MVYSNEDIEKIKRIAVATIDTINIADKEPSMDERKKNAAILHESVLALKSIANATDTMQAASQITRSINEVCKVYNTYIKHIRADANKKFIKDHVEIITL